MGWQMRKREAESQDFDQQGGYKQIFSRFALEKGFHAPDYE
nr:MULTISPECIES: hypothetical protein [unclassified Methanosarcina]